MVLSSAASAGNAGRRVRAAGRRLPAGLVALGVALFVVDVGLIVAFFDLAALTTVRGLVGVAVTLFFCAVVVAGGAWLARSGIDAGRNRRIAAWVGAFVVAFLVVNLVLMAFFPSETLFGNLSWAMFATYSGAAGGTVAGIVEARAIHRAVAAERAAVRARQRAAQREWLDYLNGLLRHEVLNNATVIQGYAAELSAKDDLDPRTRADLETIRRQSQDMTDVVDDVRLLLQATEFDPSFEPVDVGAVLAEEVADLRATHRDAEVTLQVDCPDDPAVPADRLLSRAFANLLANAVEHNTSEVPRVTVTVDSPDDAVRVRVADNGPGIPESKRDRLFERDNGSHGLGLYLVEVLVSRYDGDVEVTETGSDGTVITLRLPRTDAAGEAGAEPPAARERSATDGVGPPSSGGPTPTEGTSD